VACLSVCDASREHERNCHPSARTESLRYQINTLPGFRDELGPARTDLELEPILLLARRDCAASSPHFQCKSLLTRHSGSSRFGCVPGNGPQYCELEYDH